MQLEHLQSETPLLAYYVPKIIFISCTVTSDSMLEEDPDEYDLRTESSGYFYWITPSSQTSRDAKLMKMISRLFKL